MTDPLEKTDAMPAIAVAAPIVTPWYLDKAFYANLLLPVVALGVGWVNSKLPIQLSPTTIDIVVGGYAAAAVSYIVMHKWKTATLQRASIAADAAVAAVQAQDPAVGLAAAPK